MATAKKAPAKKATPKKAAPAKKVAAKKAAALGKKAVPTKKAAPAEKTAPTKKALTSSKAAAKKRAVNAALMKALTPSSALTVSDVERSSTQHSTGPSHSGRGWDAYLSDRDKRLFPAAGYGGLVGFGERPVVLVVDVSYAFTGDVREPIFDSVRRWHNSAGEEAWDAVDNIALLLQAARSKHLPIIYTTGPLEPLPAGFGWGLGLAKCTRETEDLDRPEANQIIREIAPQPVDIVIQKPMPSAFFGTPLSSYLIDLKADSLIVCGVSTSGCVRASVNDGFSLNYRMLVAEECTFDRGQASHWLNLFDMHMKCADVLPMCEIVSYLETLPDGLFFAQMPALSAPAVPQAHVSSKRDAG